MNGQPLRFDAMPKLRGNVNGIADQRPGIPRKVACNASSFETNTALADVCDCHIRMQREPRAYVRRSAVALVMYTNVVAITYEGACV